MNTTATAPKTFFRELIIGVVGEDIANRFGFADLSGPQLIETLNQEVPVPSKNSDHQLNRWGFSGLGEFLANRNIELAIFDLDMTLAWTSSFYTKAEFEALKLTFSELEKQLKRPFDFDYKTAKLVHAKHIHESVDGLLPAQAIASGLIPADRSRWTDDDIKHLKLYYDKFDFYLDMFLREVEENPNTFAMPYKLALATRPEEKILIERVAGATKLIMTLLAIGADCEIATNSYRKRVEFFTDFMGLTSLLSPDDMTCADDKDLLVTNEDILADEEGLLIEGMKLNKSMRGYWRRKTANHTDPKTVVVFEDNPMAARWALESGFVGLVICRNEANLEQDFSKELEDFPGQLFIVSDWRELRQKETIERLNREIP